ncbi:hypothetical protein BH18ACT1_BH18ACT1_01750 [soil metagenome]
MLPLVALVVAATGGLCLALGRFGGEAVTAARARAAADAAALAGAAEGEDEARALARANGAELVDVEVDGTTFTARVRLGDETASARAEHTEPVGGGGATTRLGLDPRLAAALERAGELLGVPVPVTSGWRSSAQQRALWARRAANPYQVAAQGTSVHEQGLAVDVPAAFAPRLARVAADVGLCWPLPRADPVHFELCRSSPEAR